MTQQDIDDFIEEAARQGVEIEIDIDPDDAVVWVSWIRRTSRKRGVGAGVLGELGEMAADHGYVVRAAVDAQAERLVDWYSEIGFHEIAWSDDAHRREGRIVLEQEA